MYSHQVQNVRKRYCINVHYNVSKLKDNFKKRKLHYWTEKCFSMDYKKGLLIFVTNKWYVWHYEWWKII